MDKGGKGGTRGGQGGGNAQDNKRGGDYCQTLLPLGALGLQPQVVCISTLEWQGKGLSLPLQSSDVFPARHLLPHFKKSREGGGG